MLVMDDITEKVQLGEKARMIERHLATVVESANDLVISTDAEGRIVSWNLAAEHISGYRIDEVLGQILTELCQSTQRDAMKMIVRRLAKGSPAQFHEINLMAHSGQAVPVDWSCSPIFDDANKVSGMVAVGRDLTERRAFEQRLIQSEKLAALGVMAGGIAHELRNPLAVSFSAAQFLLEPFVDSVFQQECVSKIIDGIQRSSAIIENLLRFARPTPGNQMEALDFAEISRETVNLLTPQVKLKNIQVMECYDDAPVTVFGNRSLLQQVLMNLILNAFQAMPDGGKITVTVLRKAGDVLAQVSDVGCGISSANFSRVFDPFFTTQPVGKGTGLGLSICHAIINQHKGEIELESVEGQGSTFTVRLPYLKG
jgi:PAS domain S-box-containing protein